MKYTVITQEATFAICQNMCRTGKGNNTNIFMFSVFLELISNYFRHRRKSLCFYALCNIYNDLRIWNERPCQGNCGSDIYRRDSIEQDIFVNTSFLNVVCEIDFLWNLTIWQILVLPCRRKRINLFFAYRPHGHIMARITQHSG